MRSEHYSTCSVCGGPGGGGRDSRQLHPLAGNMRYVAKGDQSTTLVLVWCSPEHRLNLASLGDIILKVEVLVLQSHKRFSKWILTTAMWSLERTILLILERQGLGEINTFVEADHSRLWVKAYFRPQSRSHGKGAKTLQSVSGCNPRDQVVWLWWVGGWGLYLFLAIVGEIIAIRRNDGLSGNCIRWKGYNCMHGRSADCSQLMWSDHYIVRADSSTAKMGHLSCNIFMTPGGCLCISSIL